MASSGNKVPLSKDGSVFLKIELRLSRQRPFSVLFLTRATCSETRLCEKQCWHDHMSLVYWQPFFVLIYSTYCRGKLRH